MIEGSLREHFDFINRTNKLKYISLLNVSAIRLTRIFVFKIERVDVKRPVQCTAVLHPENTIHVEITKVCNQACNRH